MSRLVTIAVSSTALLVAGGSVALAATPGADRADAVDYWTPRRMAEAVPIEQLAGQNVLIFLEGDSLARAAEVQRVGIGPGRGRHSATFSSDAWLVPSDPGGGPYSLRLVEDLPEE